MASIRLTYREKRIIIISAPNSATAQFEHAGRVYQQKARDLNGKGNNAGVLRELFGLACKRIDQVLGPVHADHLQHEKS